MSPTFAEDFAFEPPTIPPEVLAELESRVEELARQYGDAWRDHRRGQPWPVTENRLKLIASRTRALWREVDELLVAVG